MRKIKKSLICLAILLLFPMLHTKAEHVHSWSDWTVITEVSCGSKGYESRYCTSCFTEEEKVIPATGEHDWNEWLVYKSLVALRLAQNLGIAITVVLASKRKFQLMGRIPGVTGIQP